MSYDHKAIEKKAQEKWAELGLYQTNLLDEKKEKYYLLTEFPYPSGDLHIGHWYAFAVTDIYARILRARGKNVLFPIGFDAFGLPAENAAIKRGLDPKKWTYDNIAAMRKQLDSMGASFDWSKEVITCEPNYYQWTQWFFLKLFEHGLAHRREAAVKWCPKCLTVLANEQVDDGACERCGTSVEEKWLTQWFLKITDYAERLLNGLDKLPWHEEIKEAQRAWIGKSEGAKLKFEIRGFVNPYIEVFTTRPDTIFGATYLVIAPEHKLFSNDGFTKSIENLGEVQAYREITKKKTERERSENREKTGIKLEGVTAINPATKEKIPIFVADYVLGSYGTGAIMAVPAHDERDYEFAQKFGLPAPRVVDGGELPYAGVGILVNSGEFSGVDSREAMEGIIETIGGEKAKQYRLRDWLVSRQRYWGCPIPIVYDPEGKPHPVSAEHLPWILPSDVDITAPTGKAPLASSKELKERVVKIFGEGWTPEYDTLDTFVDSSWYFLRYLDSQNVQQFSDASIMKKWMPVDRYSGGSEHTTMHLLYSRFFNQALYDLALVPVEEPFRERFNRGLILGPDDQKMSKSKGNVVNPDEFVQKFGADAVRLYLAFIGPYNEPGSYPWKLDSVAGIRKFLDRVERLIQNAQGQGSNIDFRIMATRIKNDSDRFKFNTGIAALMTLLNVCEENQPISVQSAKEYLILLAPFAPHLAEHLWEQLGGDGSVHKQLWPEYDESLAAAKDVRVVVQVNGKRRGSVALATDSSEEDVITAARTITAVVKAFGGKEPARVIFVKNKIINFVLPR